eukprot:11155124-Lingulodinium_polyedra.AAC.1
MDLGALFGGEAPLPTCHVRPGAPGTRRGYALCSRASAPLCRSLRVDGEAGFAVHSPCLRTHR